jgi:hypothetical protein
MPSAEAVDNPLAEARAECYYEHCNVNVCSWATPHNAFLMNAFVYGMSTAIADLTRQISGLDTYPGFVLYLVVIMCLMYALHAFCFFSLGWGGGMLASPNQVECANMEFFVKGNTVHCSEKQPSSNHEKQPSSNHEKRLDPLVRGDTAQPLLRRSTGFDFATAM